ncbi:putative glycerol kinase 5 isoform X2 [Vespa crabro]|uniref:putative glycerol kinase 5 isoform X2 n=1 Tax=Vespa crabro TaxID=7445 RepID=UPI001F0166A0|nr:putative glycerol kinase 5 isoform X2 [Vespa crabro]
MRYIVALDVGTTTVRCHIIDENAAVISSSTEKVELIYEKRDHVEIEPDHLWTIIVKTVKDTINASGVDPNSFACFGISVQRGTFICWNLLTGEHYHNFITWKDLRADSMVKEWNNSIMIRGLRTVAYILYMLSKNKHYLAISAFKFMNTQMADQSASLFGSGCFQPGDMKITMGTGTFLNVNTGTKPHVSINGLYPLVGWRIESELVYIVEGASNDTGILMEWAKALEIYKDVAETADLAYSVDNSDGVYFIPAFTGLQAPINNHTAAAGFLGVKPTTKKGHIVRSLLESLVFRTLLLYDILRTETRYTYKKIRIDGGVSQNDFIMQLLADLTGLEVERPVNVEMSIFGAAICAGLHCGIWRTKEELKHLRKIDKIFKPSKSSQLCYQNTIAQWKRAVDRFKNWY